MRDLELRLGELLSYFFASQEEKERMRKAEEESLDFGGKFQTSLDQ